MGQDVSLDIGLITTWIERNMKTKKREISIRARKYIKNKVSGMSDYQAAIKAGYKKGTAIAAKQNIEKPRVKEELYDLMDKKGLTNDKLLDVTSEGLEAQKIHGTGDNFVEIADYAVRHKYLETALRLKGHGTHDKIVNVDARQQQNIIIIPQVIKENIVATTSKTKESAGETGA